MADRLLSESVFPLLGVCDMLRIWFGSSSEWFSVLQWQTSAVSRHSSILRPEGNVFYGDVPEIVELQGVGYQQDRVFDVEVGNFQMFCSTLSTENAAWTDEGGERFYI